MNDMDDVTSTVRYKTAQIPIGNHSRVSGRSEKIYWNSLFFLKIFVFHIRFSESFLRLISCQS